MEIKLKNITKKYGDVVAVNDVSLKFKRGELVAFLGPSGCGKTTLLRVLAGLIPHNEGEIYFNDKDISNWSAQRRNTAMVFQNYALFPHMSVEQNIAYGLKARKLSKTEIKRKVELALEMVRLKDYGKRNIQQLSGGQKQRVALARALVVEPNVLLFDEPLSNLDEKLRVSMRREIKKIQKEIGITSVYVTHDQREALSIADKIVVMNNGKVQQIATPCELYNKPINSFVANFVGQANLFDVALDKRENDRGTINLFGKEIKLNIKKDLKRDEITVLIRPEEFKIKENGIKAIVRWKENLGLINRYNVEVLGCEVRVDSLNKKSRKPLEIGDTIYLDFDEDAIHIIYDK